MRDVKMEFGRAKLDYDIQNLAHHIARVKKDDLNEISRNHLLEDIVNEGNNRDRVTRVLNIVHGAIENLLLPLTLPREDDTLLTDDFIEPKKYELSLSVPDTMSPITTKLLMMLTHEYMVYRTLHDYLLLMGDVDAAQIFAASLQELQEQLEETKWQTGEVLTRPLNPFE